jgi:putative peptidoglycan lipid II flippase
MIALASPAAELIFQGGRFSSSDARECALYFAVFSIATALWAAQAIYARAFYAVGNTFIPMAAGTAVTLASFPMYDALYHWHGALGLAIASDLGIALQTIAIAVLLHRYRLVSVASLDFAELGRCLLAGSTAGFAIWAVFHWGGRLLNLFIDPVHLLHGRWLDLFILISGSGIWLLIARWVLDMSGSALPKVALKRLGIR